MTMLGFLHKCVYVLGVQGLDWIDDNIGIYSATLLVSLSSCFQSFFVAKYIFTEFEYFSFINSCEKHIRWIPKQTTGQDYFHTICFRQRPLTNVDSVWRCTLPAKYSDLRERKKCKKRSFLEGLNCRLLLLHPGHSPTLSMTLNELDNSDPGGQFERIRGTSASNFKILDKATRCHQVSTINIATGKTSQVITPFNFFDYFNFTNF